MSDLRVVDSRPDKTDPLRAWMVVWQRWKSPDRREEVWITGKEVGERRVHSLAELRWPDLSKVIELDVDQVFL